MADVSSIGPVPIYKEELPAEQLKKDVEAKAVAAQEISVETKRAKKAKKIKSSPMDVAAATQKTAAGDATGIKRHPIPKGKAVGYWRKRGLPGP